MCRSPMHQKCSSRLKDADKRHFDHSRKRWALVLFFKVQCFQKTAMEGRYGWVRQIVVLPWIGEGKE